MPFTFHGLGPLCWPRLTLKAAQKFGVRSHRLILPETPDALRVLGMTPREAEILFWITQGKSNPEIAIILSMQLVTVKKHVQNILQKLGVENRTAALRAVADRLSGSA